MNRIQRVAKAVVERLEGRMLLAAHTWTGAGGNANWSIASNWTGGAPTAVESNVSLDFPSGVSNTSADNDISGLTIQSLSIEGSYYIYGLGFSLAGSISTSGAGSGALANNIALAGDSTLNLVGQLNLGGVISGSHNLQLNTGAVYIGGNNTYTGTTTVASGLLYLGSNTGLGSTAGATVVDSGASIMLDLGLTCAEPVTISGAGATSGALAQAAIFPREASSGTSVTNATWSGAVTLSGNASVAGRPASDGGSNGIQTTLAITGNIGGSGNLTIANGGVSLAGADTFSGSTIVTGGALTLNAAGGGSVAGALTVNGGSVETKQTGQIANTSTVSLASSTTFTIDSGDTETVGTISGSGTINGAGTLVDDVPGMATFSGPISGSASFTMNGNGRVTISGSSPDTTTGQIKLTHGQMTVDATFSNASLLQTGGELFGTGTVASFHTTGGDMEFADWNPGIFNSTGSVTLDTNSAYDWVAISDSTYSSLNAGGTVTLAGNFNIAGVSYTPITGTVFTLVNNTSLSAVSGTFSGMPEGHIISFQNADWQISYVGGDGNDVTLTYLGLPTTISGSDVSGSAILGQPVFHATVSTSVGGAPTPTGNVTFKNGATVLDTAALDNTGTATFDATNLLVASYTITAYYDGDSVFETSGPSSGISETVTQAPSSLGLGSSQSVVPGASVTLTATINTFGISVVPSGSVTFSSNGTVIGVRSIDGSGRATLATTALSAGEDAITASYAGDSNFASSSTPNAEQVSVIPALSFGNATVTKSANGGTATFQVSLSAPSNQTVTVNYISHDGTAQAARDYVSSSGTVTFTPGQTSKTIGVSIIGNSTWEPNRQFTIGYASASNASMSTTFSTATIQSSDGVPAAGLTPDEFDPAQTDLVIDAPAGNDTIQLKTTRVAGQVQVMINHKIVATNTSLDRVIIYGGSHNNTLTVDSRFGGGVIFFGGAGRNAITGGGGNDIVVGGSGANTLSGGGGKNLLIGGKGAASIKGSAAGDVLVGGTTAYDAGTRSNIFNLETLLSTWIGGGSYAARAAALAAAGSNGATLNQSTLTFDAADHLTGKPNHDLLLAPPTATKSSRRSSKK